MTDDAANYRFGIGMYFICQRLSCNIQSRILDEASRVLMSGQQNLDLLAQALIAGTSFADKSRTLRSLAVERGVENPVDLLPTFRFHCSACCRAKPWPFYNRASRLAAIHPM